MKIAGEIPHGACLESVQDAVTYLKRNQQNVTVRAALGANGIGSTVTMIGIEDAVTPLVLNEYKTHKALCQD